MTHVDYDPSRQTATLLERVRRRLVETGTRNRLVHVNRAAKRSNTLTVINERADDVFEILKMRGRKMKFAATKSEDEDELLLLPDHSEQEFDKSQYTDQYLETPLTRDGLRKRLLRLAKNARTAEEEQGVNILYLAIGFLRWFEAKSSAIQRESPLVLLPVELVRNERTSTYHVRCRDDDIVTNLPLQERLRTDFEIELPELDDSEVSTLSGYFRAVRDAVSGHPKWTIDEDGMQLGFFSFSKFLMLGDLDPGNWPKDALLHSDLVLKLLEDGFEHEPFLFDEDSKLDELLDPADVLHVVDTDASQAKVIAEVRSGRNLVVQGPPGTGKSQTITNILATAAYDGKTVLFIAEKMAALQVVYKRMVDIGLADLCLELHSKSANKKAFLKELAKTLSNGSNGRAMPEMSSDPKQLREGRDELNRVVELLHTTVPKHECSPYEVISSIVGFIGREVAPRFSQERLADLSKEDIKRIETNVDKFAQALVKVGNKTVHPLFGVKNLGLQPTDMPHLKAEIVQAVETLNDVLLATQKVYAAIGWEEPASFSSVGALIALLKHALAAPTPISEFLEILSEQKGDHRFQEAVAAGATWVEAKSDLSKDFTGVALEYQVGTIRTDLAKGVGSFFSRLFRRYRSASSELSTLLSRPISKVPRERLALVDRLLEGQSKLKAYKDDEGYLKTRLGELWRGDRTDFPGLNVSQTWLVRAFELAPGFEGQGIRQLLAFVMNEPDLADELTRKLVAATQATERPVRRLELVLVDGVPGYDDLPLPLIIEHLSRIRGGVEKRYREWVQFHECRTRLLNNQVDELIQLLEDQPVAPNLAVDQFLYATAEARWGRAISELPRLNQLAGMDRHQLVESFKKLDRAQISDAPKEILFRHLKQVPQGASGEMGFLRGEIAKKSRHRSIRRAMIAAGPMVQRIKPVFMMSPISVAQFLPPGRLEFDLLVIDEASQVRPEEALGAIARAKQIVVVGDQKQLPPTSFFDRLADDAEVNDEEEDEGEIPAAGAEEMESILTLCEARGLMPRMLEYHYRSRDPSLITVSNKEFYEDRLVLPPSPLQLDDRFGLKFTRVPGAYSSRSLGDGRPGTNRLEAVAVVRALADHAKTYTGYSIGIVTFSKAQADMMTEVLELERRQDSVLNDFLKEGQYEDVFVKNIENVQGDERDVILISVGYGPREPNGRLASMNFGPINSDGGERRLNVLFTRARVRCEVFASFDPGEIDLSRTKKNGPRVLKRFLEFAKSGVLDEKLVTGEDADSPFEEDVARVVASMGYEVDLQVGSAGFKIDLGVRHPNRSGQYVLAVECDGATYHSAIWARERDRQRQEILEGLGWRFHRIWSTDWFHNRNVEIDRLKSALVDAVGKVDQLGSIKGANLHRPPQPESDHPIFTEQPIELKAPTPTVPAYRRSNFSVRSPLEPHEVQVQQLGGFVASIVEDEGPIHTDEVARRLATGFGKARAGSRIQSAVEQALRHVSRSGRIKSAKNFWFTAQQEGEVPIRNRSAETVPTTKPEYLSGMEIHAAAKLIFGECGHVESDELVRSISRLLGYKRAGQEFQSRVKSVLQNTG